MSLRLLMLILSIGALSATFISSLKILAFFATNVELSKISNISIYGSFRFKSISFDILSVITELLNNGYFYFSPTLAIIVLSFKIFFILTVVPFFRFF